MVYPILEILFLIFSNSSKDLAHTTLEIHVNAKLQSGASIFFLEWCSIIYIADLSLESNRLYVLNYLGHIYL